MMKEASIGLARWTLPAVALVIALIAQPAAAADAERSQGGADSRYSSTRSRFSLASRDLSSIL